MLKIKNTVDNLTSFLYVRTYVFEAECVHTSGTHFPTFFYIPHGKMSHKKVRSASLGN